MRLRRLDEFGDLPRPVLADGEAEGHDAELFRCSSCRSEFVRMGHAGGKAPRCPMCGRKLPTPSGDLSPMARHMLSVGREMAPQLDRGRARRRVNAYLRTWDRWAQQENAVVTNEALVGVPVLGCSVMVRGTYDSVAETGHMRTSLADMTLSRKNHPLYVAMSLVSGEGYPHYLKVWRGDGWVRCKAHASWRSDQVLTPIAGMLPGQMQDILLARLVLPEGFHAGDGADAPALLRLPSDEDVAETLSAVEDEIGTYLYSSCRDAIATNHHRQWQRRKAREGGIAGPDGSLVQQVLPVDADIDAGALACGVTWVPVWVFRVDGAGRHLGMSGHIVVDGIQGTAYGTIPGRKVLVTGDANPGLRDIDDLLRDMPLRDVVDFPHVEIEEAGITFYDETQARAYSWPDADGERQPEG